MPVALLYTLVVLIWGSSWFVIKFQVDTISPELSIVYRMLLAGGLTILYCLLTRKSLRFSSRQHLWIALQGALLFCCNYILIYFAGLHLTSGLLAICFSTVTLMNIFNMAIFYRAPIQMRTLFAALVGIAGLFLIFYPEVKDFSGSGDKLLGVAFALSSTFCASLGMMVAIKLRKVDIPILEGNAIGMIYGSAIAFLIAIGIGQPITLPTSVSFYLALLYLAIPATIIAFACYLTLVDKIGPSRAAYSSVLFPLVALTISTIFENYQWTYSALAGMGAVLFGNILVLTQKKMKPETSFKMAENR